MHPPGRRLAFYAWLSRRTRASFRTKVALVALLVTPAPVVALWFVPILHRPSLFVALAATLVGASASVVLLHELLAPLLLTAEALRAFRRHGRRSSLPTTFTDEVGQLMSDAQETLSHLGDTLDAFEHVDEVTGLPNRRRFEELLDARIASGQQFAVGVVRFANHATFSETLGRAPAEEAVRVLAARLAACEWCQEQLARVAPGAFACVMDVDQTEGVATAERLRAALRACSAGLSVGSLTLRPHLLGGLSMCPHDAEDSTLLVDHAVAAAAQAEDHAPVLLHSPQSKRAAVERFRLETDLRRALDEDQFELHYQPIVDLDRGRAIGAEALIRWRHPERGLLMPATFIPIAEATGLIDPIDIWVLRRACEQLRDWNATLPQRLQIAINLSARQLRDPELTSIVLATIDEFGIGANQLEIELTETAAMADHEHTRRVFGVLRAAGVRIAIDDFGTGYSSLSYVNKLPFDKLKIDREFVSNIDHTRHSQAICSAMVALARGLDLTVLAEGTETRAEVQFLADLGCRLFQGFYFAKPMPALEFQASLDRRYDLSITPQPVPSRRPITGA